MANPVIVSNEHSIELRSSDSALPTEFRIFKAGANPTTKGVDVFDAAAAEAVIRRYREQGVELPIDLEHDSLSSETRKARANASDAMGWFKVALRNGELWAVDVRWTPEGARRLRGKSQRYISPAFMREKDGRVVELVNVALVAMPATHGAPELVAASRLRARESTVIAARVPNAIAALVRDRARVLGKTPGEYVRSLVMLAKSPDEDTRKQLFALLNLPDDADDASVRAAIDALLAATAEPAPPADFGPTAGVADSPAVRARRFLTARGATMPPAAEPLPPAIARASKDVQLRYRKIRAERRNPK